MSVDNRARPSDHDAPSRWVRRFVIKLLHVLPSMNPAEGGTTEAVRQMSKELQRLGHDVHVMTLDAPAAPFLAELTFPVHALGPTRGFYGYHPGVVPWLKAHAPAYDAVVVNGLWRYHALATWQALRGTRIPYYVYPHGMLDPWFKSAYPLKHLKKWLYWPWADYRVLRDARAVLFTSEEERLGSRQSFWLYRARERLVAFGTDAPPSEASAPREKFMAAHPHLKGRRLLLFLGRIQAKKGCDLLIRAFAAAASEPSLHLVMAGPDTDGWASTLKKLASELGVAERITWTGLLRQDMKWGAFFASEAFVLPSHQENFGIAVAEALGCGVAVLISNKVNIWREIEAAGAGLVEDDTQAGASSLLARWLALDTAHRQHMSDRARELFTRQFTLQAMAQGLLEAIEPQR